MVKKETAERAIVVCTAKRGVFFGYTTQPPDVIMGRAISTITHARMCVYWSAATKGVMGLASIGPQKGSRIGPMVPELTFEGPTAVMVCTDDAIKAWESGTWTS
jgi:hypothetical protein